MIAKIKRMVKYNLPVKITALTVAVVLWFLVMADQNPVIEGTFDVEAEMINVPRGYKVIFPKKETQITVRAARSFFINTEAGIFHAYADLAELAEGTHQVPLKGKVPQNFEFVGVSPETVTVTLDKFVERKIPAELIVSGQPAPNTMIADIEKEMDIVTVAGPRKQVDMVARVVGYVGLSGNDKDFSLNAPISAINADGREVAEVRVIPGSINVHVQLARGLSKKVVAVEADVDNSQAGYTAKVGKIYPAKIEIAGENAVIEKITKVITEKISTEGRDKSFTASAKLSLPEGVTVTDPVVSVEISLVPAPKMPKGNEDDANDKSNQSVDTP